jgi:membrane protease YdiL (CAAX protease family)
MASAIWFGAYLPLTRRFYEYWVNSTHVSPAMHQVVLRIPVGTALSEEVIFRGSLLAVSCKARRRHMAVLLTSCLFGLWHIAPTLGQSRESLRFAVSPREAGRVAVAVAATTVSGCFLCWLRLQSGSILAPWLVHGMANASGYLAGRRVLQLDRPRDVMMVD